MSEQQPLSDEQLLHELEPTAATLLDRHLEAAKEWFPHELVPWERSQDLVIGEPWRADDYPIPDGVREAIQLNLLTEDGLPYYHEYVHGGAFSPSEVLKYWSARWTAEEGRHSTVIRDWATVSRVLDPYELERERVGFIAKGEFPAFPNARHGMIYATLQELATQIAHRNTGNRLSDDKAGRKIMATVAGDEGLHHRFYRDLTTAGFEIDPSSMVIATEQQVHHFDMPGKGIPEFEARSKAIATAGIYSLRMFKEDVVEPTLEDWGVEELTDLSGEAERAREKLFRRVEFLGRVAARFEEQAAAKESVSAEA